MNKEFKKRAIYICFISECAFFCKWLNKLVKTDVIINYLVYQFFSESIDYVLCLSHFHFKVKYSAYGNKFEQFFTIYIISANGKIVPLCFACFRCTVDNIEDKINEWFSCININRLLQAYELLEVKEHCERLFYSFNTLIYIKKEIYLCALSSYNAKWLIHKQKNKLVTRTENISLKHF